MWEGKGALTTRWSITTLKIRTSRKTDDRKWPCATHPLMVARKDVLIFQCLRFVLIADIILFPFLSCLSRPRLTSPTLLPLRPLLPLPPKLPLTLPLLLLLRRKRRKRKLKNLTMTWASVSLTKKCHTSVPSYSS